MIKINLDVEMAKQKIGLAELAAKIDITPVNLSILKNGRSKSIRLATLNKLCSALGCTPGDLLDFEKSKENETSEGV